MRILSSGVAMGPHSLASKFQQVAVPLTFKGSSSRRGFSGFRATSIRASTVDLNHPQGVRGGNYGDLRLFVDSANLADWERFLPTGAFYGVTTHPILLKDANMPYNLKTLTNHARSAIEKGATEVQLQTWGKNADEMFHNGLELWGIDCGGGGIVVKIPCTEEGLKAAKILVTRNIRVTMTGLFSVHQVLMAIGVGATYASPYLGRMDTVNIPGMTTVKEMQNIIQAVKSDMRLLVASIQNVKKLTDLAACGVNSFAIKGERIKELLQEPNTDNMVTLFEGAVAQSNGLKPELRRSNTR